MTTKFKKKREVRTLYRMVLALCLFCALGSPAQDLFAGEPISPKCESHYLFEPYPRLYLKGTSISGGMSATTTNGTYVENDQCFPEAVVLRVLPCETDEVTFWCCNADGASSVLPVFMGDRYSIQWTLESNDLDHSGFFVDTDGAMFSSIGGSNGEFGNETVVYHPPWSLAIGETRFLTITIFGDDHFGDTPPALFGDDPPLDPSCPTAGGPGQPGGAGGGGTTAPPVNPTLSFLVTMFRDESGYDVEIVPPDTPTCREIEQRDLQQCPLLEGLADCGCLGMLSFMEGDLLQADPTGAVDEIKMCQGMMRPMNVDAHDDDIFVWDCGTMNPLCEDDTSAFFFRDAISHEWVPTDPTYGSYLPTADGESGVYRAEVTDESVRFTSVGYTARDTWPTWCANTGQRHFLDAPVEKDVGFFIFPEIDVSLVGGIFPDEEDCPFGNSVAHATRDPKKLDLRWPSAEPGWTFRLDTDRADDLRFVHSSGLEILPGNIYGVNSLPIRVEIVVDENADPGPALAVVQGLSGQNLMSQDVVAFHIVDLDLKVDSNNDGAIGENDNLVEMDPPGKILCFDFDDDNGNEIADRHEPFFSANNDYGTAIVDLSELPLGGYWRLVYPPSLQFFQDNGNPLNSGVWQANSDSGTRQISIQAADMEGLSGEITVELQWDADVDSVADVYDEVVLTIDDRFPEVQFVYETFIAPEVIALDPPLLPPLAWFSGDNRSFQYDESDTFRTRISADIDTNPLLEVMEGVVIHPGELGLSTKWGRSDVEPHISTYCNMPYANWRLLSGAGDPECGPELGSGDVRATTEIPREIENRTLLYCWVWAAPGCHAVTARICAQFFFTLRVDCEDGVGYTPYGKLSGLQAHSLFPWHEAYANGHDLYQYSPCGGEGNYDPFDLIRRCLTRLDTGWIEIQPPE